MKRVLSVISAAVTLGVLLSASVPAFVVADSNHNPAGNNGFVQINRDLLADGIPQNQPHVGCTFNIEFYNYDQTNTYADVAFALQAPTDVAGDSLQVTSGNQHPFIGADAASGSQDLDAREAYTLSFSGQPQPNQGYHVKVTVTAPGSQGNDTKTKVYWVEGCNPASTPATNPSKPCPPVTTSPSKPCPPKTTPTTSGTTSKRSTPAPSQTGSVLGATTVATPAVLPNTGAGNTIALFAAFSAIATVGHYIWRARRMQRAES